MNFLAHIYLSGNNPKIRTGNFIGDFVKGNKFFQYEENIQIGIKLHREIDSFTDKNIYFLNCVGRLRKIYGKYAGIPADLFFDYFLAENWADFSNITLKKYTKEFYIQLIRSYKILPDRVKGFLPFLIARNRLYNYRTQNGIINALGTMSKYTSLPDHTESAKQNLSNNYEFYKKNFYNFMPEIINFSNDFLKNYNIL